MERENPGRFVLEITKFPSWAVERGCTRLGVWWDEEPRFKIWDAGHKLNLEINSSCPVGGQP